VTTATAWDPPPAPDRDLWWHALRIAAPEGDYTVRHRRGAVQLPYDLHPDIGYTAGALVEAWVCCDPVCGGVELDAGWLAVQHACCDPYGPEPGDRRHTSWGAVWKVSGWYHGPYTAWWEPETGRG
jgi:hypothetical protein